MKQKIMVLPAITLALIAALFWSDLSRAHHSFSMFEKSQEAVVKGVISKVEWRNPHVYFFVEGFVEGKDGTQDSSRYTIESGSINLLARKGWKRNSIKVGDSVSVAFYPLRNGKPGGLLVKITLPDGTVLEG